MIPLCEGEGDGADRALQMVDQMASRGLRVLAVAQRSLPGLPGAPFKPEDVETGLTLLGLIGLHDPPRAEVRLSLQAAREAGIKVGMVTGDHAFTAAAIARETGLIGSRSWCWRAIRCRKTMRSWPRCWTATASWSAG